MRIYVVSKLVWDEDWCDTEVLTEFAFRDRIQAQEYIREHGEPIDYIISEVELR